MKNKKIKLLLVDPTQGTGGTTKSLLSIIKYWERSKFEPLLLVHRDGPFLPTFKEFGVCIVEKKLKLMSRIMLDPYFGRTLGRGFLSKAAKLAGLVIKQVRVKCALLTDYLTILKIAKQKGVDLIHFNAYGDEFLPLGYICRYFNIPVLFHVRGRVRPTVPWKLFGRYAFFVYVSNFVKDFFLSSRTQVKGSFLLYNGRDPEEHLNLTLSALDKSSLMRELSIPQHHKLVVNVSTLTRGKGQHTFIKAASVICRQRNDVTFLIVGDNVPYEDDIKSELIDLISNLHLEGRVLLLGQRADIPELLAISDISVVATELEEALCGVNIETMASKTPLIATDIGSVREVVIPEKTGVLVPPGDHRSMADAVLRLLENEDEANKLAEQGYQRFLEIFNAKKIALDLAEIYEQLINRVR